MWMAAFLALEPASGGSTSWPAPEGSQAHEDSHQIAASPLSYFRRGTPGGRDIGVL